MLVATPPSKRRITNRNITYIIIIYNHIIIYYWPDEKRKSPVTYGHCAVIFFRPLRETTVLLYTHKRSYTFYGLRVYNTTIVISTTQTRIGFRPADCRIVIVVIVCCAPTVRVVRSRVTDERINGLLYTCAYI